MQVTASPPALKIATKPATAGALLWLLCFQFFVAEQVARLHVHGPYSMSQNFISDLGAMHLFSFGAEESTSYSPWHGLMNTSFILQGLLIFFGAWLLRSRFHRGALTSAAFLLFRLSGLGLLLVGLAPEDVFGDTHVLAASVHFLCGSLAMLLLGLALLRRSAATELAGTLSIGFGTLALVATILLGSGETGALGLPPGAVERVAAYPLPLWLSAAGLVLFLRQQQVSSLRRQV